MKSECDKCMEKTTKRIELLNEAKLLRRSVPFMMLRASFVLT